MSEFEDAQARAEALEAAAKVTGSTYRARLWAGLNRYLAAEAEHERKVAREERTQARGDAHEEPAPQTRQDARQDESRQDE